jgi:glycosidase
MYPLGFCGAPNYNDFTATPCNRINKIENWIDHLKSLNINALYLGPIFESTAHGYDTADYYNIDRRLGTNEDFKKICQLLHHNGIKIIIDGVFNHVGRDFWAFKDILKNGQSSPYLNWFCNVNFENRSPYEDPFSYDGWEGYYNLVKLNLRNPEVKDHIFNAIKKWLEEFNIDGLRLDVAYCLDRDFLKELSQFCKNLDSEFWLLGEAIHGDYTIWANNEMLASVTNYECYKGFYSSHNSKNLFELAYAFNRQYGKEWGIYKHLALYNFVDNHDVNRIASILNEPKHLYSIYTLLFSMPGIPSIYYGSEFGIQGEKINGSDEQLRPSLDLETLLADSNNTKLLNFICSLSKIRINSKALQLGDYKQLAITNEQFVFSRSYEEECIIVAVNLSPTPQKINITVHKSDTKLINLLEKDKNILVPDKNICIEIPAYGYLIFNEVSIDNQYL